MIGIAAAFFSMLIKKEKPHIAMALCLTAAIIIFELAIMQLSIAIDFMTDLVSKLHLEVDFFGNMVKMLGIAYVAELATAICKDSGHSVIAGQIELFAKVVIVTMSIPILTYLIQIMGDLV